MISSLPGFYTHTLEERVQMITEQAHLTTAEVDALRGAGLSLERANAMIENCIGLFGMPLGVATNFRINGREMLVPMVIEEPSVVAGASLAAKLARAGGGFHATSDDPIMIGQVQLLEVRDPWAAAETLLAHKTELLEQAHQVDAVLAQLGGGARDLRVRVLEHTAVGPQVIVHLIYDVRDAMGANAINTACEQLSPRLEALCGGRAHLRILSNLADQRLAYASVSYPESALAFRDFTGEMVARGVEEAWAFAAADPYRAATHNKGIMNGVDAVVLATGNDWRAVEAGAHAYAAREGVYTSLSVWRRDGQGNLVGSLELPMALGIIGGATRVHPAAQVALKLLGVTHARELAEIAASVGLAQNFAALRALATDGIQQGHMRLHARQVALAAGASTTEVPVIAETLVRAGTIRLDQAEVLLHTLRERGRLD